MWFAASGGTHLSDLDVSDGHREDGGSDEGHGAWVRHRTHLHLDPMGLTLQIQIYIYFSYITFIPRIDSAVHKVIIIAESDMQSDQILTEMNKPLIQIVLKQRSIIPVWAERFLRCVCLWQEEPLQPWTLRPHSAPSAAPTSPVDGSPHSTWRLPRKHKAIRCELNMTLHLHYLCFTMHIMEFSFTGTDVSVTKTFKQFTRRSFTLMLYSRLTLKHQHVKT